MASFNEAVVKTLAREGGARVTNVAGDKGGTTKYGISQTAYPTLDIARLTEQQACDIYKRDYWDRVQGDNITSQIMAENIFDTAVNMGVRTTSRFIQVMLGIAPADGIIGRASLDIINRQKDSEFLLQFTLVKVAYYANICNKDKAQSKFLLGWINRTLGAAS
jgi:lysozyme family protein